MKAETRDALDTEFAGSLKADIGQLAGYPVRPDIGYSGYFFIICNNIFCKKINRCLHSPQNYLLSPK